MSDSPDSRLRSTSSALISADAGHQDSHLAPVDWRQIDQWTLERRLWRAGSMDDWCEISRLQSRVRPFHEKDPLSEKLAWLSALHIPTEIDRSLDHSIRRTIGQTHGNERATLVVDGPGHLGKSWSVLNWAIRNSGVGAGGVPARRDGYRSVRVGFIEAESGTKVPGLMASMCAFAGLVDTGNERRLRSRLDEHLPRLGTSVVIVDDAHMLKRKSRQATEVVDGLRAMLRLRTTFVFVMTDTRYAALSHMVDDDMVSDASDAQIRARRLDLRLRPWRFPEDQHACRDAIKHFVGRARSVFPELSASGLKDRGTLNALVERSGGKPGQLFSALKSATGDALCSGSNDLSSDSIRRRVEERGP